MSTVVLAIAALVTSTFSGILGMGGGILLLAVMGQYFPLAVLIPLHGFIQFASNFTRTLTHPRAVKWSIVGRFAAGSIAGAVAASFISIDIPENIYQISLGTFVLFMTFGPINKVRWQFPLKWPAVGAGSTFLGIFFGATGPLIAPVYLNENLGRQSLVATKAACQSFLHMAKMLVFFSIGFSLQEHLGVLVPMLLMVLVGSLLGRLILERFSERTFRLLFQGLIALLAIRLIVLGTLATVNY